MFVIQPKGSGENQRPDQEDAEEIEHSFDP